MARVSDRAGTDWNPRPDELSSERNHRPGKKPTRSPPVFSPRLTGAGFRRGLVPSRRGSWGLAEIRVVVSKPNSESRNGPSRIATERSRTWASTGPEDPAIRHKY
ncbi:MAG TPA: hypothetical protein DDY91_19855 [Planctomycetaceae bacterium]|nr:hypothetical protein [Planctomycetaceae bacterium]